MDVECGWVNAYSQGRSSISACLYDRNNIECSAYMWVVLLGTEVAYSECDGCKWLHTSEDRSS